MTRSHFSLLVFMLSAACGFAGISPAHATVTATAQASIQVSAYVVSDCSVRTSSTARSTAEALRAVAIDCQGMKPTATVQAQRMDQIENPPSVAQVRDGNTAVVVVTY
jgi:hypothetical protein